MKTCPDGNPCGIWFIADGSLVCRHGLVSEASDTTAIDHKQCPGEIIDREERAVLKQFIKDLPIITKKLTFWS